MQAVRGLQVTVQLQPSVENHPIFTDVYIMIQEKGEGVAFIEVKNPTIAVHLESESPAVAQTLREAHMKSIVMRVYLVFYFLFRVSLTSQ